MQTKRQTRRKLMREYNKMYVKSIKSMLKGKKRVVHTCSDREYTNWSIGERNRVINYNI